MIFMLILIPTSLMVLLAIVRIHLLYVGLGTSCSQLDAIMTSAYDDKPLYCDGGRHGSAYCQHWSVITQHLGQHYLLPGISISKTYICILICCVMSFNIYL